MTYFNLGNSTCPVSTTSDQAQLWCDRGLIWTYGFHHEEAITCFERALAADPDCAFAHWGIAYAIGPNYNKGWIVFGEAEKPAALATAKAALAKARSAQAKAWEHDLIAALQQRFPEDPMVDDFAPYADAYANAMRDVHRKHPDHLDVCALFTEALMNRTPWQLWDLKTGEPAMGADTLEARNVLETAFDTLPGAWDHPGLLHLYIHLMEMSPTPECALPHGDRLATLVPDAGHLLHMATHIDVLCGDYQNVIARNQLAYAADQRYMDATGRADFYRLYVGHNLNFIIYGAMFLGQPEPALRAADQMIALLPEEILRPMANWFEAFIPMRQHVLIRFGMWDEILDQTLPRDAELYSFTTAMMRYARAVAAANLGCHDLALVERDAFMSARVAIPEDRMLFNNSCHDILAIAQSMMLGEIAYKSGDRMAGIAHLRQAVHLDDTLAYDEPWGWMQPTRHALGALLMDSGDHVAAEAVYRADLGLDTTLSRACQHPGNVWSLHGLHECLNRRDERVERPHIKQQLDRALARATVPIQASCFCRTPLSEPA
ncbi:hypothetical protein [Actibacterium sp. 188UL27-1]|uniref:hypothetical protein n=1 Tax=Actibacterium sp. 188UL27-1 TaxID=2786961 RepID=UPI00195632DE|nr:hypothetical protein [Actibacterium sp. 188UL27-1]MBM7066564.1 hypothetical protein [Actibacterium sp. 188UL27-1]